MPPPPQTFAKELGFSFNGQRISAATYGGNYIPEFERILSTYAAGRLERVLEWGSGLSTQMLVRHAEQRGSVKLLLTIDTNQAYQQAVLAGRRLPRFLQAAAIDLVGLRNTQADPGFNYSTYPLSLGCAFDFIYIDGRRRLECALVAALLSHPETVVVLHDYRRTRYQPVLAFFDVREDGPQFRVLRPRAEILAAVAAKAELIAAQMNPPGSKLPGR